MNGNLPPHGTEEAEPVSALSERNSVDDNHLSETDDAATTNTLDAASDQDDREVISNCCNNAPGEEKCQADVYESLATEDVRERSENRLEYGRGKEERSSTPKGFDR